MNEPLMSDCAIMLQHVSACYLRWHPDVTYDDIQVEAAAHNVTCISSASANASWPDLGSTCHA